MDVGAKFEVRNKCIVQEELQKYYGKVVHVMEEVSKDLKDERNVDDVASGFKFDERNETE